MHDGFTRQANPHTEILPLFSARVFECRVLESCRYEVLNAELQITRPVESWVAPLVGSAVWGLVRNSRSGDVSQIATTVLKAGCSCSIS